MDKLSSIVTRELFYRKLPVEDLFPRYVVVMHSDKHRSIDGPPSLPHQKGKMFAGEGEAGLRPERGQWGVEQGKSQVYLSLCLCDTHSQGGYVKKIGLTEIKGSGFKNNRFSPCENLV